MLGRFLGKGKGKNKDKNEESTPQEPAAIPDSEDRTMLGMQSPMAPPAQVPIAQPAPTGVPPQPVAPPPVATAPPPAPEGGGNEDRTMLGMQSPIAPPAQAPVAQPMPTGVPPTPVATPPPVAATPPPAPNAGGNEDRTMLGMQSPIAPPAQAPVAQPMPTGVPPTPVATPPPVAATPPPAQNAGGNEDRTMLGMQSPIAPPAQAPVAQPIPTGVPVAPPVATPPPVAATPPPAQNAGGNEDRTMLGMQSPIAPPAQAPVAQPMPTGVPATPVAPPVATPPPIAATPPPAQNAGGNEDRTMLGMQSPIAPPAQAPVAQPVPAGVQPAAPTVATPPVTAVPDTAVHDDRTMLGAPSPMLSKTMQIPSSMAPTGEVVACSTDAGRVDNKLLQATITLEGRELTVSSFVPSVMMGRDLKSDLTVIETTASRNHAKIELIGNEFVITDHSTNGTYIKPTGGPEAYIQKQQYTLKGSGLICLGLSVSDPEAKQLIQFACP